MIFNLHHVRPVEIVCLCAFLGFFSGAHASESVEQNTAEAWFYDDSDLLIDNVNEGELKFIEPITEKNILYSEAGLKITESSLQTGWVELQQCYRNLDSISKTDIVYRYKNIKKLKITSLDRIGEAKVDGQIIRLKDISASAYLCVQAKIQILEKLKQGGFYLSNGPYHRKFFDGYYPYHVSLNISYPGDKLELNRISPASQAMFKVIDNTGELFIDTWFEGILQINIEFSNKYKIKSD